MKELLLLKGDKEQRCRGARRFQFVLISLHSEFLLPNAYSVPRNRFRNRVSTLGARARYYSLFNHRAKQLTNTC